MPKFLDECERLYGTRNLYELLGIDKEATTSAVKRAYFKLSLEVHPDKVDNEHKDEATSKFQVLSQAYSILSDKDKRGLYDDTGEVDEEGSCLDDDKDWYQYWRLIFGKISVSDIKKFEIKYRGSKEELEDLKAAYKDYKGDMDKILETVLCATYADDDRFTEILQDLINKGELEPYDAFVNQPEKKKKARKRKAAREAAEAKVFQEKMELSDTNSLEALIAKRQKSRAESADSFFDHLEQKYGKQKCQTKKGRAGKKE